MTRRITRGWLPMLAVLTLACDDPTAPDMDVPPVTLDAVGDFAQLEAANVGASLPHWESLDPAIVAVTPAGLAVAVAPGTATVRARLGRSSAEGTVTVRPAVAVVISDLAVVTDAGGTPGMGMRLRNEGGRGYYRLEYWRERAAGETEHQRLLHYLTDHEAEVGMDITARNYLLDEPADWVVAYSREPASLEYRMTGCARLDGGEPCPVP